MAGPGEMVLCVQSVVSPLRDGRIVKGWTYTVVEDAMVCDSAGEDVGPAYRLAEPSSQYRCPCCGDVGFWPARFFREIEKVDPPVRSVRRLERA